MYEHHSEPMLPRALFLRRVIRHVAAALHRMLHRLHLDDSD